MNKTGKKISFQSKLVNWAKGMDYCALAVPAKVTSALGTKKAVLVLASINGSQAFQVSLFPAGGGRHFIRVRAKVRKQANLNEGDKVKVQITLLDPAKVKLPKDLITALKKAKAFEKFNSFTPGKRNYLVRRINDAQREQTRIKRITETIEMALKGGKPFTRKKVKSKAG